MGSSHLIQTLPVTCQVIAPWVALAGHLHDVLLEVSISVVLARWEYLRIASSFISFTLLARSSSPWLLRLETSVHCVCPVSPGQTLPRGLESSRMRGIPRSPPLFHPPLHDGSSLSYLPSLSRTSRFWKKKLEASKEYTQNS